MKFEIGTVKVITSDGPPPLADMATEKIINVSHTAHPVIRAQAEAFQENIRGVIRDFLAKARQEEKIRICAKLTQGGQADLAAIIREI